MASNPKVVSEIKDKAERYFEKGRFKDALGVYESIRDFGAKDPRIYLRIGDISRKLEDKANAIAVYKEAVGAFTKLGFIVKAIAVCKMIIQLDPSEEGIQEKLTALYALSGGTAGGEVEAHSQDVEPMPQKAMVERKKRQFPKAPLFSDLTDEELLDVVRRVKFLEIAEGKDLFKEGDRGDSIFIVIMGALDVSIESEGKGLSIANLKENDFFGEFGFFSNSKRTATVRTLVPVELLEITKYDMDEVIKKHPRVEDVMLGFYKERVVQRLLALSRIFGVLKKEERAQVLKRLGFGSFKRGALILKEGEKGDTMYLIKEGVAGVWTTDENRERKSLGELGAGDFFGEVSLATLKPRTANVSALTELQAVIFPRDVIKYVMERHPRVKGLFEDVIKERVIGAMKAKKAHGRGSLV